MAEPLDIAVGTIASGWGGIAQYKWAIIAFLVFLFVGTVVFFVVYWIRSKEKWNLTFRVRQEDKQNGRIYLDPGIIKARRVTLSNGMRLIFLEKEILGKRLFPNLNHYTRPGVYDLILSADNRIFLIDGIKSIDQERKELNVGIRYPGIDIAFDELNRDHAKLNEQDRRSDLLGIVKAASIAIIAICLLIGLIVGGKYWIEGKEIDAEISKTELNLLEGLENYQSTQLEQTNAMRLLIAELGDFTGSDNLRRDLEVLSQNGTA